MTPGNSKPPDQRFPAWFVGLLLVFVTLAVYWPVRHFEFLNYDDVDGIERAPAIRGGLSGAGVAWAFANRHMGNWQPLTSLSHMLDCQFFGLRAGPPHVVNLVIHIANTLLLFLLLRGLTGAQWRSACVAGFFALHPLHVESVAWVSERKDVLSTFFFLLTLIAYARYAKVQSRTHAPRTTHHAPRPTRHVSRFTFHASIFYILSLLFFALGLMSKPMLVTVPFVLLLLDYWPLRRMQETGRGTLALVTEKVPFIALAGAVSWITFLAQDRSGAVAGLSVVPLGSRVANIFVSYARYLGKMVWPEGLVAYYPRVLHWSWWQIAAAVSLLAAITLLVLRLARCRPYLAVGWLWFLGTLVPVIGLVQVGTQSMADRYTYIPLIGLFVMAVWGVADGWPQQGSARAAGLALLAGALVAVCGATTAVQVRYWRSSLTLFTHALAVRPDVPLVQNNIGSALYDQGRFRDAIPYLKEALRLKPGYVDAYNNLGLSLWRLGRDQEAIEQFNAVLQHTPDAKAYYNKGVVLFNQGTNREAAECFAAAVKLAPNSAEALNNLGNALASLGRMDEAGEQFAAAVAAAPYLAEAQWNLARYYADKGAPGKAVECYVAALRARPGFADAHLGLARLLEEAGQFEDAAAHYAEALRLQPDLAEAHNNLSNIAARKQDSQLALTHAQAAVRLKPDWAEAHYNLANAYFLQQKLDSAATQYVAALSLKTNYLEAHQNLGYALEKLGRNPEAAEQYQQVIKLRPQFAAAYLRLGTVLAKQARYPEAIRAAEEGARLAKAGGELQLLNELQAALQTYRRAGATN